MSLKAMLWVMDHAPVKSHTELAVLYALADHADDTGGAAYPGQDRLADRARCSVRTVRRTLKALEEAGVISRGDQRHVAHIRPDRRPTVWQLHLELDKDHNPPPVKPAPGTTPATGQNDRPSEAPDPATGGHDDRPCEAPRPDTQGRTTGHPGSNDRTPRVERPDTAVSYEPSLTILNPPRTVPPVSPQGDQPTIDVIDETPTDTPPPPAASPGVGVADVGTTDHTPSTAVAVNDDRAPAVDSKRGRRLTEDWQPSPTAIARIREQYPGLTRDHLAREFEKFQNHWLSSSGANARKRDWDRTWINWMHRFVDMLHPRDRALATTPQGQPVTAHHTAPSKQQQARDIAATLAAEYATGAGERS